MKHKASIEVFLNPKVKEMAPKEKLEGQLTGG